MDYKKLIGRIIYTDIKTKYWFMLIEQMKPNVKYKKYPNIIEYLDNLYNDSESSSETLYRVINDIDIRPTCVICGHHVTYDRKKMVFRKYCCSKCAHTDPKTIEKFHDTCIKKYGVINPSILESIKEKTKNTCIRRYGVRSTALVKKFVDKRKTTCIEKYDVEYPLQNQEFKDKQQQTMINRYGAKSTLETKIFKDKVKRTNLEKYGCEYTLSNIDVRKKSMETRLKKYNDIHFNNREKAKSTCIQKYGVSHYSKSKEYLMKCYETKKKNHTFNSSKPEDNIYDMLKEVFPDTIRHKSDDPRYPFEVDFYIPSLDLFIEYQGVWTHGPHEYNPNNQEDIDLLELWKSKINSEDSWYISAIKTWTEVDPHKRSMARNNNLNFIEFWDLNEVEDWIKTKKKDQL